MNAILVGNPRMEEGHHRNTTTEQKLAIILHSQSQSALIFTGTCKNNNGSILLDSSLMVTDTWLTTRATCGLWWLVLFRAISHPPLACIASGVGLSWKSIHSIDRSRTERAHDSKYKRKRWWFHIRRNAPPHPFTYHGIKTRAPIYRKHSTFADKMDYFNTKYSFQTTIDNINTKQPSKPQWTPSANSRTLSPQRPLLKNNRSLQPTTQQWTWILIPTWKPSPT